MILDNRTALNYLLADQRGVCALTNTSCCFYVNASGLVGENADRLLEKAAWLTEASQPPLAEQIPSRGPQALPSMTWFLPSLSPLTTIVLLLIFGPCILNCLVSSVSKRLESIKLQMVVAQGYKQG